MLEAGRDENNAELKQKNVLGWASLISFKLCSGTEGKILIPCETNYYLCVFKTYIQKECIENIPYVGTVRRAEFNGASHSSCEILSGW